MLTVAMAGLGTAFASGQSTPERLSPVRRIGSLDGPLALTEVRGLVVVDSLLWIAQSQEQLIRVVTNQGRLVRTVGRSGDGPGEFRRIDFLGFVDGEVVAIDLGLRRRTYFDPSGGLIETEPMPRPPIAPPAAWLGAPYGAVSRLSVLTASVPGGGDPASRLPVVLAAPPHTVLDTLAWFNQNEVAISIERGGRRTGFRHPLQWEELHSLSPEGRYFVQYIQSGDSLTVSWYDITSRSRTTRGMTSPAVRIPRAHADSIWRQTLEVLRRRGYDYTIRDVQDGMIFPASWSSVSTIQATRGGGAWLRETSLGGGDRVWRFVHATRPVQVRVRLDGTARIFDQDERFLWGTVTDEYGVHYVVAWPLPAGVAASARSPTPE